MKKQDLLIWSIVTIIVLGTTILWLIPYFNGLKEINPVIFKISSFSIHWYGLLIALGVLIGLWWIEKRSDQMEFKKHIFNLSTITILSGIIGARLLFVILKWSEYSGHWLEIFNLNNGGLSIHGAIIGGILAICLYSIKYRLNVLEILDIFVPPVLLAQAIGRFGNFFNQEAFGPPTQLPWKMFVKEGFRPSGLEAYEFFHPTFLYSAIGLTIILLVILLIERRKLFVGASVIFYFLFYSFLRFVIEFFRVDSDHLGLLTIAQWGSLIIIIVAVIVLILRYRFKRKRKC